MSTIEIHLIGKTPSGATLEERKAWEIAGRAGVYLQLRRPDGSSTTLRVEVGQDGSLTAGEPVLWDPSTEGEVRPCSS